MAEASDRPAPFVASDAFAGARAGYYFRLGENGLGYYEDVNRERAPSSVLTEASSSGARGDTSDADDGEDKKPTFKVDLFEWYRKRLLSAVGKRTAPLVDTGEVVIRVTSLWPHGAVGVVDSASAESPDDAGSVSISCDVGVSVEWRAVVKLGDSESVLGTVLGRVKLASAKLREDGSIAVAAPELLVGGEKSAAERERDARQQAREEQMRREMEDMRVGQDPDDASSGEQDPEEEQPVVPLEIAAGPKLDDVARDAMRRFGLERVTNQFARCVADCVAKASGGDVAELDVNAPWVTATNTSERANEHTAPAEAPRRTPRRRRRRRRFLQKMHKTPRRVSRDARFDGLVDAGDAPPVLAGPKPGGAARVPRRDRRLPDRVAGGAELRATHFWKRCSAVAACSSEDAPRALDLSRSGMRDAEAQRLVAVPPAARRRRCASCASRGTTRSPR